MATYAIQHNIRGTLNEMLNLMLRQMPEDPVRYLADLLESRERASGILEAEVEHRTDSMGKPGLVISIVTSKRKTSFAFSCVDRSVSNDSMYMDGGIVDDEKITPEEARALLRSVARPEGAAAQRAADTALSRKQRSTFARPLGSTRDEIASTKVIPRGTIFVLGDCASQSVDSRVWGTVDRGAVVARPVARIWPPGGPRIE